MRGLRDRRDLALPRAFALLALLAAGAVRVRRAVAVHHLLRRGVVRLLQLAGLTFNRV